MLKQNQTELLEMKNTAQQIRTSMESLNNTTNEAEERTSELEDTSCINPEIVKKLKKKLNKSKRSIQELRHTI